MNSVKILHMADLHIGRKFKNLPPRKATVREAEVLLTLEDVLQRFDDARIVLLSGDVFEENAPFDAIDFVCDLFAKHIHKSFFISCGNHDCRESAAIKHFASKMSDNVYVFSDTLEKIVIEDLKTVVYGISFAAPGSYTSLIKGFRSNDTDYVRIMTMHGDTGSESRYNPLSLSDIAGTGLDYLALGHIHSFSGIGKAADTSYAYPGVLEPGGFDEEGECGAIYGTVRRGDVNLKFFPVSKRMYCTREIDVTAYRSNEELIRVLKNMISPENFYRVILTGTPSFFPDIALLEDISDAFYLELANRTSSTKNILNYNCESSLRGKTAACLCKMKDTYREDVFDMACEILTKLMCKD